jgi:hypothetical protein
MVVFKVCGEWSGKGDEYEHFSNIFEAFFLLLYFFTLHAKRGHYFF